MSEYSNPLAVCNFVGCHMNTLGTTWLAAKRDFLSPDVHWMQYASQNSFSSENGKRKNVKEELQGLVKILLEYAVSI